MAQNSRTSLEVQMPYNTANMRHLGTVSEIVEKAQADLEALGVEGLVITSTSSIYSPNPAKRGKRKVAAKAETTETTETVAE